MRRPQSAMTLVLAVLALAACTPKRSGSDAAAASTPPAATLDTSAPPRPTTPLTFSQKTPDAEANLEIDKQIARWPRLQQEIYARGAADLRKFVAEAKQDRAERTGDYQPPEYEKELTWSVAAATPRLVSLQQAWYESAGGAHPNHGFDTYLWDMMGNRSIGNAALFTAADDPAIQKALCDAIDKAHAAKGGEWDPEMWPCPKWRQSKFVLAPSTIPGKIGGLVFLFNPYDIGPYVDGEFEIPLPQSVFRSVLSPAFASEFAGEARPSSSAA